MLKATKFLFLLAVHNLAVQMANVLSSVVLYIRLVKLAWKSWNAQ